MSGAEPGLFVVTGFYFSEEDADFIIPSEHLARDSYIKRGSIQREEEEESSPNTLIGSKHRLQINLTG